METKLELNELLKLCKADLENIELDESKATPINAGLGQYTGWGMSILSNTLFFYEAQGAQCLYNLFSFDVSRYLGASPIGYCGSGKSLYQIYIK